jgi:hypothetical protein
MPLMMVWPAFVIGRDAEGRILGGERLSATTHLFLVGLGLRLHRQLDNRLGEFHALEDDRLLLGSHSVSPVRGSFMPASATMSPA